MHFPKNFHLARAFSSTLLHHRDMCLSIHGRIQYLKKRIRKKPILCLQLLSSISYDVKSCAN
jgi:hypothetical protein